MHKGGGELPRSKKDTGNKPLPANKQKGEKICNFCHESKKLTNFYISKSPLYSVDERVPVCKDCVISASLNEDGTINELELNKILKKIDKPYYKDLIESAIIGFKNEHSYVEDNKVQYYGKEILQRYFRLIAMRQDINKSYEDSEKDNFIHPTSNTPKSTKEKIAKKYADIIDNRIPTANKKDEEIVNTEDDNFEVTQDMIDMFGEGYTRIEYKNMYKKYNDMQKNYTIQTNIHKEALLTYVRFKVKEELATAKGDVQEAQKWYSAAQDAADKAKLTPKQLSKADLQGGITNFSDIFKAVEEANERIPIFPEFKYRPNDAVDFILWCYINYERNLNGLPEVKYSDIYKFYDEKKKEYIDMYGDPYGIFTNDPTLDNRDTVEKFITVPIEFREGDE